jgi:hypothetical protein
MTGPFFRHSQECLNIPSKRIQGGKTENIISARLNQNEIILFRRSIIELCDNIGKLRTVFCTVFDGRFRKIP